MLDEISAASELDGKIVLAVQYEIESIGKVFFRLKRSGTEIKLRKFVSRLDWLEDEGFIDLIYYKDTPIHAPFLRRMVLLPDDLNEITRMVYLSHERRLPKSAK